MATIPPDRSVAMLGWRSAVVVICQLSGSVLPLGDSPAGGVCPVQERVGLVPVVLPADDDPPVRTGGHGR